MSTSGPAALPPNVGPQDRIVLFDGVCKLCAAWTRFLIRYDRDCAFKLASMQSPEGAAILEWARMPSDIYETMVVIEGPRIFTKSAAFLRVMRGLPLPWRILAVLQVVPGFVRDWCYDRIAKNRYALFGKHDVCLMPSPDHLRHFLHGAIRTDAGRVGL